MNDSDLKKLKELIKEEIRTIKEQQSVINEKIDGHTKILERQAERLDALWEQTVKLSEGMEEVKEVVRSYTKSAKNIVAITDQYSNNVKRLNKRVGV